MQEWVSEWAMCWNWNEMLGQLPNKVLLDLSGLRGVWSKALCTNYEKMSLAQTVESTAPPLLPASLSSFYPFSRAPTHTHCCVILLLYYSKLTVEWVKWPVQQGCCCHCCSHCSLSVCPSACPPACLLAYPFVRLFLHLRKEIRCFVTLFTQLAFGLKIHFSCKLFGFCLFVFTCNWHRNCQLAVKILWPIEWVSVQIFR